MEVSRRNAWGGMGGAVPGVVEIEGLPCAVEGR